MTPVTSCPALHNEVHGARESTPLILLLRERPLSFRRELIDAPAPAVHFRPPARQQACAFKPVQCRIERAFGQVERAFTAGAERLGDRVAVSWTDLHGSQEQEIEMAFQ